MVHLRMMDPVVQSAILDYAQEHTIEFAVRAKMSQELREMIVAQRNCTSQPIVKRDGTLSERESSCRMIHMMNDSRTPFTVVVQRKPLYGQQLLDLGGDSESALQGGYLYRAIATNRVDLTDSELIHWYNQRAEHSENRIKELKNDFAGQALPCSDFKANELYFALCGLADNLFALMRHLLPARWAQSRVITVRWRLYALAGKVVHHGRRWSIKLSEANRTLLEGILRHLRRFALAP